MKYYYDLHIHSVLSPCADDLMTPNNICNMAHIKGLDIISITDHNCLKNIKAFYELSKSYDFLFIPGVEITVKEGFDVLCYFYDINDAYAFDKILETYVVEPIYNPLIHGESIIMDENDNELGYHPFLLSKPSSLSIKDIKAVLSPYKTVLVYAHVDRPSRSGRDYIKAFPLDGIEYQNPKNKKALYALYNSDAHQLLDMLERTNDNTIELKSKTKEDFFKYFNYD
ncbi:MAG: PHP domain-containing protein [Acholeplasma sp.]|nr:PHP domain-containing protein [Acholeplasma sp.]